VKRKKDAKVRDDRTEERNGAASKVWEGENCIQGGE